MNQNNQPKQIQTIAHPRVLQYSIKQYVFAPSLVKHANEWLQNSLLNELAECKDQLRGMEASLEEKTHELVTKDIQLQLVNQELYHLKEDALGSSIVQHALSVLTAILFSIGINLVTTGSPVEVGWPMICCAIITQSISFYITYSKPKLRKTISLQQPQLPEREVNKIIEEQSRTVRRVLNTKNKGTLDAL